MPAVSLQLGFHWVQVLAGNFEVPGSITFSNEVRFGSGKTVDFHGATLYGNVVRSLNGKTGDVVVGLTGINDPTTAVGDLVIKTTGSTFTAYSLFNGDFDPDKGNMPISLPRLAECFLVVRRVELPVCMTLSIHIQEPSNLQSITFVEQRPHSFN